MIDAPGWRRFEMTLLRSSTIKLVESLSRGFISQTNDSPLQGLQAQLIFFMCSRSTIFNAPLERLSTIIYFNFICYMRLLFFG